jgi:phage terminase small subunit
MSRAGRDAPTKPRTVVPLPRSPTGPDADRLRYRHLPPPPDRLSPEQRAQWLRMMPMVADVAGEVDVAMFELMVVELAMWLDLTQLTRERPVEERYAYESHNKFGTVLRVRPEVATLADCGRRLTLLLGRFGLSPADRGRVMDPGEGGSGDAKDPDAEFTA